MEEESIVRKNKAKILNERENDNQCFYTYSRNAKLYYFKDTIFFLLHFDEDNFPYYIEILEFDENNEDIFNFTNSIRIDYSLSFKWNKEDSFYSFGSYSYFFIGFTDDINVHIFKYNDKAKSLSYKSKIELPKRHFFHNIIENKNGNVVILENNPRYRRFYDYFTGCQDIMSIWEDNNYKFQRSDNYESGWFYDLKNINERLFLVLSRGGYKLRETHVLFYDSEYYTNIKRLEISTKIGSCENINNNTIALISELKTRFYVVDIKNFQIIQVYKKFNEKNLVKSNKFFGMYNYENNIIKLKLFFPKFGDFREIKAIENCEDDYEDGEVLITDKNLLCFIYDGEITIFKI